MAPPPLDRKAVFLNIPYDQEFSSLYIAYIVGLYHLGLFPHHRGTELGLKLHFLPKAGASSVYALAVFRELCLFCSNLAALRNPGTHS